MHGKALTKIQIKLPSADAARRALIKLSAEIDRAPSLRARRSSSIPRTSTFAIRGRAGSTHASQNNFTS
jgi:hypothetical protein